MESKQDLLVPLALSRRSVTLLLGATALSAPALAKPAAFSPADAKFNDIARRWLDAEMHASPIGATQTGDHRFDHLIDDKSTAARKSQIKLWKRFLAELTALDRSKLNRDNQVDAAILSNRLRHAIWDDEVFESWAWDTRTFSQAAGDALYGLMSREFAPLPVRMRAALSRMEKLPQLFAQMRETLVPARVPAIYATTLSKQNGGVTSVVETMVLPHAEVLTAAEQTRLHAAADTLKTAVAQNQDWIDKTLVPNAKGDFRIGAKLFDEKLAFTLNSPMTRQDIRARAEAAVTDTRAAMYTVSRKALAGHADAPPMPDQPNDAQQQAVIEAALNLAYAVRPARDAVVQTAKDLLAKATDFVRTRNLITLPDAPVEVVLMPEFARGVAVAYCDSPGPLDKSLKTYFDVMPIPDDWTQAQVDSFLREYNSYGIQDVAVHEAMPGHFVQLWHADSCPSILRAVLGSGSFIEGWAVYAEGMMVEQGFRADEPLYKLSQLKVLLRTVTNAILDQMVHVEGITKEDAIKLMTQVAFQQESEAAGKWVRAQLSSTQLSTYFVGVSEHNTIRAEAQKRGGASFDLKAYHDKVLSFGNAPARYVRALMFDEPI